MADDITELVDLEADQVDGVLKGANGFPFLVLKAAAADTDSATGAKEAPVAKLEANAMAGVIGAFQRANPGSAGVAMLPRERRPVAKADGDPPDAEDGGDAPSEGDELLDAATENADGEGLPTPEPGDPDLPDAPAWEAVDAAMAREATQVVVQLRAMVSTMRDREATEAVQDGGHGYSEDVFNLEQVLEALDCALTLLARFAVDEQAEADAATQTIIDQTVAATGDTPLQVAADLGAEPVTKAAPPALTVEDVVKAGKRLSTATEAALKQAMATLKAVLDGTLSGTAEPAEEDAAAPAADALPGADAPAPAPAPVPVAKAATPSPEEDTMDAKSIETPEFQAVLKSTLSGVVKEELAAALKPLEDRLAVVEHQPMPGGPVLKGQAPRTDAAQYQDMIQPRSPESAADAELAPVLKALETETDPARISQLRTEIGRIQLARVWEPSRS